MLLSTVIWGKSSSPGTNTETQIFLIHISSSSFSHGIKDAHNRWCVGHFVWKFTLIRVCSSAFRPLHSDNRNSRLSFHLTSAPPFIIHMIFVKGQKLAFKRESPCNNCIPTSFWSQRVSRPLSLTQTLGHHEQLMQNKLKWILPQKITE